MALVQIAVTSKNASLLRSRNPRLSNSVNSEKVPGYQVGRWFWSVRILRAGQRPAINTALGLTAIPLFGGAAAISSAKLSFPIKFATDSPLEQKGFELVVPLRD